MNTNGLAKMYDKLTPRERLPLLLAARERGDDAEFERLMRAAPRHALSAPDHFHLAHALHELAMMHALQLLSLAACFWQAWGLWLAPVSRTGKGKGQRKSRGKDAEADFRTYCMTRHYAFRLAAHVDGWKQFCAELNIGPDAMPFFLPGRDMLARTEPHARELAFTREEVVLMLMSEAMGKGNEIPEQAPAVETADGLAKEWHYLLDRTSELTAHPPDRAAHHA